MSAYQQSPHHIEAVVGSAVHYGFVHVSEAIVLARELALHNALSVNHCYPGDDAKPVDVTEAGIIAWDTMPLSLPELRMAAAGLAYQCCEHPEWMDCGGQTTLAKIIHTIPRDGGTRGWSITVSAEQWEAVRR